MSTLNGKIISKNWGKSEAVKSFSALYEKCHESFKSQGWIVGRVTMEEHFSEKKKITLTEPKIAIKRIAFVGDKNAESFAIAIDAAGKLRWKTNELSGDHIIEVLTEQVSDAYLNYLQKKKVSYIFAGKKELDFKKALEQLSQLFNIKTLMLEGGGLINGSLLNAGLIDELSILIVPVADSSPSHTTFEMGDYVQKQTASLFEMKRVKKMEHGVLWIKYQAK